MIFTGFANFESEDGPEELQIDDDIPNTAQIRLREPARAADQLTGSGSHVGLGTIQLRQVLGVSVSPTVLLQAPNELVPRDPKDLCVFADAIGNSESHILKMAYQGSALVNTDNPSEFSTPPPGAKIKEDPVDFRDYDKFFIDCDVQNEAEVWVARTLSIPIDAGRVAFPNLDSDSDPGPANRLVIFTGTAILGLNLDNTLKRGVLRVRLRYPLGSIKFVGSATISSLASFLSSGNDFLLGADAAETIVGPNPPGGKLPLTKVGTNQPLPADELYALIYAAIQSTDVTLHRLSYQANVLVRDTNPDLKSILVRQDATQAFAPTAIIGRETHWDLQINFDGPVPAGTTVLVESDNPRIPAPVRIEPIGLLTHNLLMPVNQPSGEFTAPTNSANQGEIATITGTFKRADGTLNRKSATVTVPRLE
jgi:hypothetical protein